MAKLVDVLAMLCRKGFGSTEVVREGRGSKFTVRELYEAEEKAEEKYPGDVHSQIDERGLLVVMVAATPPIRLYVEVPSS